MHARILLFLSLTACLDSTDEPDVAPIALIGPGGSTATLATTAMANDAAAILKGTTAQNAVPVCSATIIGAEWILTARRCDVRKQGYFIGIYNSGPLGFSTVLPVLGVVHPSGTSASDFVDTNGVFADLTLVKIAPLRRRALSLGLEYWYGDTACTKVGNGRHGGVSNDVGELRYTSDNTHAENGDGSFLTASSQTNVGDAGGALFGGPPFYRRLMGVNAGTQTVDWLRDLYTSVPRQLEFILHTVAWTWPGSSPNTNTYRTGALLSSFTQSQIGCQYACSEWPSVCVAYNHSVSTQQCELLTTTTGFVAASGWTTASLP